MRNICKKIFAAVLPVIITLCLSGCGDDYVMTEEDLAVQKQLEGCWAAETDTGYNTFDEDGNLVMLMVIEFTDDFHYLMHECYMNENQTLSYEPIAYSIEEKDFKVVNDGVASYARVNFSSDGQYLYWITDDGTDTYARLDDELVTELGIPAYSPDTWAETESGDESTENTENTGESEQ